MWYGSGFSFKGIAGALLLSCFIAGVVTALTSPVTAKNAAPTVSVNRIIKGDRLPPVPATKPKQHEFNSGPKRRFESRHWSVASQPSAPSPNPRGGIFSRIV